MEKKYPISELEGGAFSRHSTSARHKAEKPGEELAPEYPSLTQGGVEKARETARTDLLETINRVPEKTLLFIGGKSDQTRTGHTGEVYGEELQAIARQRKDLYVLTKREIDQVRQDLKQSEPRGKIVDAVKMAARKHPEQKVVVDYPLWIKELSYAHENRWTDKEGRKTDYFDQIVKKYGGSHALAARDWIENQGRLELPDGRVLTGPKPEKVAKEYLRGLSRLQAFAHKMATERPVVVHGVGHQWDLDAVVCYLAKGKVDKSTFDEVCGGRVIDESEMVSNITVAPGGKTSVQYRGRAFQYNPQETK